MCPICDSSEIIGVLFREKMLKESFKLTREEEKMATVTYFVNILCRRCNSGNKTI